MGTPVRLPDRYKGRCAGRKEKTMKEPSLLEYIIVVILAVLIVTAAVWIMGPGSPHINPYP